MSYFSDVERDLVIAARTDVADGVVALDLVSPNGRDLPAWTPGSHIDLVVHGSSRDEVVERQYSLCSHPAERGSWRVAVLREDAGRGGSVRVHESAEVGARIRVRGPRNHFPFTPEPGLSYRFVAGGIGITPLMAMVAAAAAAAGVGSAYWDDSWHTTLGRDSTFIPPHLLLYASILTVGVVIAGWGWRRLAAQLGRPAHEFRTRGAQSHGHGSIRNFNSSSIR